MRGHVLLGASVVSMPRVYHEAGDPSRRRAFAIGTRFRCCPVESHAGI
jgi:hypothetical protein